MYIYVNINSLKSIETRAQTKDCTHCRKTTIVQLTRDEHRREDQERERDKKRIKENHTLTKRLDESKTSSSDDGTVVAAESYTDDVSDAY